MIFADRFSYGIANNHFILDDYIGYCVLGSLYIDGKYTPSDSTARDKEKFLSLFKALQEHHERRKIGTQTLLRQQKKVSVWDIIGNRIVTRNRTDFSYGYNDTYGTVDTTGTSSGLNSKTAIHKAVTELIEKNELYLFWYCGESSKVSQDKFVSQLILENKFVSHRVELFHCQNISTLHTFIAVLIHKNRIAGSGIAIHSCPKQAIKKALSEAKLIEWHNVGNPLSPLTIATEEVQMESLSHIDILNSLNGTVNVNELKETSQLEVSQWISSIDIHVLNTSLHENDLTIKSQSKDLFNCLPTKENICNQEHKKISVMYRDQKNFLGAPDCILL